MKIGDIYYIRKGEWESRGKEEKYNEIRIDSETPKDWGVSKGGREFGTINKRSGRLRVGRDTVGVYTKEEMDLAEFSRKHRYKIAQAIQSCPNDVLVKVAELIGYEVQNENTTHGD